MKVHILYLTTMALMVVIGFFLCVRVTPSSGMFKDSNSRTNAELYYLAGMYMGTKMEAGDYIPKWTPEDDHFGLSEVDWKNPDAPIITVYDGSPFRDITFAKENDRYIPVSDEGYLPMPVSR